jgi:hypothetical protein
VRKRTIGVLAVVLVLATSSCETQLPNSDSRDSRAVAWGFFTAVLNHDPEAALRYTDGSIEFEPLTKVSDFMHQQTRTTGGPVLIRSPVWSRGAGMAVRNGGESTGDRSACPIDLLGLHGARRRSLGRC